jgi:hypothetical protein
MQSGRVFRLSSHRYARLKQSVFVSRSPGDEAMPGQIYRRDSTFAGH